MKNLDFREEIIYQIYPKSFYDSTDSGYGDLKGIIKKLPYLNNLGITTIWISPVFKSPMKDNGYDIEDYKLIDSIFGTNEDMYSLIKEAEKFEIKVMLDLVVNHTSDQHKWFKSAKSSKNSPYRDYYIWRDEPNDMKSIFLGSAWEKDNETDQYYFHLFAKEQPDLNWANKKVRKEIYDMINFWIEKGVKGFRMDVIEFLGKDVDRKITSDGPKLHKYIKEMTEATFDKFGCFTVGESWSANDKTEKLYTLPSRNELSMIFRFDHITTFWDDKYGKWLQHKFDLRELKNIIFKKQLRDPKKYWNTLFWGNHDLPRSVSTYIEKGYEIPGAKMLFGIIAFMSGTPFIYQGEEIGMTNLELHENDYKDIEAKNALHMLVEEGYSYTDALNLVNKVSRDNARTPMQWNSSEYAGFSNVRPWIKINPNYKNINVEKQTNDRSSVLNFYKQTLKLRKSEHLKNVILYGEFTPFHIDDESLFMYQKKSSEKVITVIANFSPNIKRFSYNQTVGNVILNNYEEISPQELKPYQVVVFEYSL